MRAALRTMHHGVQAARVPPWRAAGACATMACRRRVCGQGAHSHRAVCALGLGFGLGFGFGFGFGFGLGLGLGLGLVASHQHSLPRR